MRKYNVDFLLSYHRVEFKFERSFFLQHHFYTEPIRQFDIKINISTSFCVIDSTTKKVDFSFLKNF